MSNHLEDDFDEGAMFSSEAIARPAPAPVFDTNPLAKWYRLPGITVTLPSGGAYSAPGTIRTNMDGTVNVKPMGAAEELLMSSPDALMSGFAIEEVIKACVPSVGDPRKLPAPDVEVLMLAIRAASYGSMLEIEPDCPECGREHSFDVSLPSMLSTCKSLPPEIKVEIGDDLVAYMRPITMEQTTRISLVTFEETRKAQALDINPHTTEEARRETMNAMLKRIAALNSTILGECVIKIVTPTEVVTDRDFIMEFVREAPSALTSPLDAAIKKVNALGLDNSVPMECQGCGHKWTTGVELNQANFFARAS